MNAETPPKNQPRIKSAPKIRQFYWCDFPNDAQLPEFWKRRPVIIVSYKNTLHGAVTVVPCTTKDQKGNKWAYPLTETIDGKEAWAICDKISTFAVSRLIQHKTGIRRIAEDEFNEMLEVILTWLPKVTLKND